MNQQTLAILNDAELLAHRQAGFDRLQALFDGKPMTHAFVLLGVGGGADVDCQDEPERWVEKALDNLAGNAHLLKDPVKFRPLSVTAWPYGVHLIDRLFGADVFPLDGDRGNWQAHPLATPVGRLRPVDFSTDPTWSMARRHARAFLDAGVSVPLFGLPVLSSPLNIILNLYGQRFLEAILLDGAAARADLRVVTDAIACMHDWYRRTLPPEQTQCVETCGRIQPPGHGQLCGCSTHLLSGAQYAEFIAPLDEELLSAWPGGGLIHLCGAHAQHIPAWRAMKPLRALQLNDRAAADLALYFAGLRPDQILYVNPCEAMPVDRIMAVTGGRRVVIVADVDKPLPVREQGAGFV